MNSDAPSAAESSIRVTKRKLHDAFQNLDDAVSAPPTSDPGPSPTKRSNTGHRSLYSTLAKYGIKTHNKEEIAARSASIFNIWPKTAEMTSKARKAAPSFAEPTSGVEYRPSSTSSFLSRLSTFKIATYANKPAAIDSVAAAKCGWVNDGKDRLVCALCHVSWVVAGKTGLSRDAANALVEKQRDSLVNMHKNGCPWRTKQCDASIYRIPLQSPATTIRDIVSNASKLDYTLQDVQIRHPLLPPPSQKISNRELQTALLISLFGWSLVPERPKTVSGGRSLSRMRSGLSSRAESVAPGSSVSAPGSRSVSVPVSPAASRASSVAPEPETIPPLPPRIPVTLNIDTKTDASTALLHCTLCRRRVGVWAFVAPPPPVPTSATPAPAVSKPQRQFDLLQEHRSYCPYVVKSTVIPSMAPPSTPSAMTRVFSSTHLRSNSNGGEVAGVEGWKAVLAVIQRYGLGRRHEFGRQRQGSASSSLINLDQPAEGDDMQTEEDGVGSMMEDVKSRGGRDLLKYVKGLLG
ncbi:zf-C3HC-domain-containing protein [Mycena floridula]|nr:zf-C3HC-domain-containing protein [Mycena floridula]